MNENQKTVLGFLVMGIILGVGGTIGIQLMLVFLTNDKDNLDTSEIPLGKYCDEVEAGYQGGCMQRPEKTIDPDISDKVVGIKETNSTQPITRTTNSTYPDISNQMEGSKVLSEYGNFVYDMDLGMYEEYKEWVQDL